MMNQAISEYIRIYGEALHLPEYIIEDAEQIIKKYDTIHTLRGNTLEVMACAALLLSCKLWNNPINAKIISATIPVPTVRKDQKSYLSITKMARKIARDIDFRPQRVVSVDKYIDMIIVDLGLGDDVRTLSYWINSLVNETNSSTQALASTIVYLASKCLMVSINEKQCVSVLHITEPALRKCKRQLIMQGVVIKKRSRYYLGGKDGKEK